MITPHLQLMNSKLYFGIVFLHFVGVSLGLLFLCTSCEVRTYLALKKLSANV